MVYKQITDFCFGPGKLDRKAVNSIKQEALSFLKAIQADEKSGKLPIIALCREDKDLKEIEDFANHIKANFKNLIILGTGGSSLCGHVLSGFVENKYENQGCRVIYMQNIDPQSFAQLFSSIKIEETAFLGISKSGNSIETLTQFLICLEQARTVDVKKHFFAITTPGQNPLRNIAEKLGIKTYDHDPSVGGRFSIQSLVGLMPGIVSGIDPRAFRRGAKKFLETQSEEAAESASIHVAFMRQNIWHNVLMTYPDNLEDLNIWYRQIWAESIGKNGTGSTPIKAMGTIDQHSQMQLYLAGRKDKFYNFITLKTTDNKFKITNTLEDEFAFLKNKSLGDLMNAEQNATIDTLISNGRPVRTIELEKLDDEVLGMLVMHLMLETILTAYLLGVNPYDQPAVEEGKIKTRKAMGAA